MPYFVASEFDPFFVVKLLIKTEQNFSVDEINKTIANVAVILNIKNLTLMSQGRYRKS
jgi:hypothetical protein